MSTQESTTKETTDEQQITQVKSNIKLSLSLSEVVAWVLVSISTILFTGLYCCGCLRRDKPEIQVLTTVLQSMKWRATLAVAYRLDHRRW